MTTWDIQICLQWIVLSTILVWYVQFLWSRRKLYIYSWAVPGPFAFPIIGSSYLFVGSSLDIMNKLLKLQSEYPSLTKLWLGPWLLYAVQDPVHIEKLLTNPKCLDKFYSYTFIEKLFGDGLATAKASKWRKHRKVINRSFSQKYLDMLVEIFAEQSVVFTEQLMEQVGKKNIDLLLLTSRCTLDTMWEAAMGVKINVQTTNSDFGTGFDRIMEITTLRMFKVWLHLDFIWKLHPMSKELDKYVGQFHNFTSSVIKKKIEEYKRKKAIENSTLIAETEGGTKKKLSFLDFILEYSDFTEEELRNEVELYLIGRTQNKLLRLLTMEDRYVRIEDLHNNTQTSYIRSYIEEFSQKFFENKGSDTTATTICNIFVMLGLHQDVQQNVYEEVVEILGEHRIADASDLPKLKYTERVMKETLRLFPAIPFIARAVEEDVDLGEAIIPAGSSACFGFIFAHRNPTYWPMPLKFDPDRFLPEEVAKRHPVAYMPFSLGPRNCVGGRHGMMNMRTILSTVIRKFKISTEYRSIEEIEFEASIVLKLKQGPKVSLQLR